MSNPLWDYSLKIYRLEEVASLCLALQDTFDMDVNLLLYAAWLAHLQRSLSDDHLVALDARVSEWREQVVKPVRGLRRELRAYASAASVRDELKSLELRAEREQQEMMYAFHQRAAGLPYADDPLLENLARVALLASADNSGWDSIIRRLASRIPQSVVGDSRGDSGVAPGMGGE
jgi:uncharacterized protein (TIGR02444 family)